MGKRNKAKKIESEKILDKSAKKWDTPCDYTQLLSSDFIKEVSNDI